MQIQLERNIQSLIQEFPSLGSVLSGAGIGCAECSLGTCCVKDILEIHNLDTGTSRNLLQSMGEVIYADAPFDLPLIERKTAPMDVSFCPPIARMMEEHTYITRVIACVPRLVEALHVHSEGGRELALGVLDFIRQYADRYHHAKEEDILFGFFDQESQILGVMTQDHREGRAHVMAASVALEAGDLQSFAVSLGSYGELLTGHIHREDHILYPWMNRTLTTRQVGELFTRCQAVERQFQDISRIQEAFVKVLETRLQA